MELSENPIQSTGGNAMAPTVAPSITPTIAPREPEGRSATGVSVLLFADAQRQSSLVSDARTWFQQQGNEVEFIVISPDGPRLTPLSGAQEMASVQNLEAAIQSARHEHLAVIDAAYPFEPSHWNIVDPTNKPPAFRSWSYAPSRGPGSRKLLVWIYCWVVRFLLGVVKNQLALGITTFTKSQLAKIDLAKLDVQQPDSVSQLLSLAKSKCLAVEEYQSAFRPKEIRWTKSNSTGPHFPKSKSIKRSIKRGLSFWFSQIAFPARQTIQDRSPSAKSFAVPVAAILLLASALLFSNNNYPLFEPDETRNAQLAMNILATGQWTALELSGEPYWDKPPLLAWMTAISYKCFGISEWSSRLPSILTSLFLLALMVVAGGKLIGIRAASIGTAALLLAWGFAFQTRYITMDALLTFFTTAATLGIAVAHRKPGFGRFSRGWLIVSGIAIGFGILAKGPVCVVLTVPPMVAWMLLSREISKRAIAATLKFVSIPAAIVAAPWFIAMAISHPEFVSYFFWKHHVVRFSDAFNHQEPFWYYGPVLWLFMFPASILLPRVAYVFSSKKAKFRVLRTPEHGLLWLSALWILAFFSMSQCKLPAYILPAFPLLTLLIGAAINFEIKNATEHRSKFDRLPKRISVGVCLLSVAAAGISVTQFGNRELTNVLALSAAIAVSVLLLVRYPLKRSTSRKSAWLATSAIALIFVFVGVNQLVPSIAIDRSILNFIAKDDQNQESRPVIYFGRDSFASSYYLPQRSVFHVSEDAFERLEGLLSDHPESVIVASKANIDQLQATFGDNLSINRLQGRHTFGASFTPQGRVAAFPGSETIRK